jgi:PKD repeat protein
VTNLDDEGFWENHFFSVVNPSGDVLIVNATIVGNRSFSTNPRPLMSGPIFISGDTVCKIYNTIFYDNDPNQIWFTLNTPFDSHLYINHTLFPDGQNSIMYYDDPPDFSHVHWGEGNILNTDADPLFVDDGTYQLSEQSPCIGAGTLNIDWPGFVMPETDVYGNPRVTDGRIDMGAVQFQGDVTLFSATPLIGFPPLTVQFTCNSTGDITSRAWDFNNSGTTDSTEQNPEFTYIEPGAYSVRLSLNSGVRDRLRQNYIIVREPIIVNFEAEPTGGDTPLTVQFFDLSTGDISSWEWDFNNDGTIDSTEQNPVYTYTQSGYYSVRLSVNDGEFELVIENMIYASPTRDVENVLTPQVTSLFEAYPNPFNPETRINYSVGIDQTVIVRSEATKQTSLNPEPLTLNLVLIEVYNIKGQKVRTLVDSPHTAGYYSVVWNGRDDNDREVASGVYLYRMKVGSFTDTKRMILMK